MVCLRRATTSCVVQKEKTQTRITFNNLSTQLTVNDLYKYVQLHLGEDRPFQLSLVTGAAARNGGGSGVGAGDASAGQQAVSLEDKKRSTLAAAGLSFEHGAVNMVILVSDPAPSGSAAAPEPSTNGSAQKNVPATAANGQEAPSATMCEEPQSEQQPITNGHGECMPENEKRPTNGVHSAVETNGHAEAEQGSPEADSSTENGNGMVTPELDDTSPLTSPVDSSSPEKETAIPAPPPLPAIEYPVPDATFNRVTLPKSEPPLALEAPKGPRFVGLVNQAMTCYLNSLLQALFMTPEFRNALYNWQFDGDDETKSIPYQLQRLFLNLQTSPKAVETTDLTRSFGWDSSEAWQQHDIQELCRVLFDALELKFKKTKDSDLINRLYQGTMVDYLKCLGCGTEKQREDTFLDIPLPVKPFGQNVAFGSIEEALRAFIQPEILNGNNQYSCDTCGKKSDAHKGLKFSKFPYILTLHLKRFDFDYQTFHRIKLNDKVTFPQTLNLNTFLNTDSPQEDVSASTNGENGHCTNGHDKAPSEEDEGLGGEEDEVAAGPYVYDLFAIMIHSGSASGGHYYVYIRDFESGQWSCFNDMSVSPITMDDIEKSFGGNAGRYHYSGAYTTSTNAYMLMYRQVDKQRNELVVKVEDLPPHIQELRKNFNSRPEVERPRRNNVDCSVIAARVYQYAPTGCKLSDVKIHISGDYYLDEVLQRAYDRLSPSTLPPLNRCRLVVFDRATEQTLATFEDPQRTQLQTAWDKYSPCDFLLEVRSRDATFRHYKGPVVHTRVYVVDIKSGEVNGPQRVPLELDSTVAATKAELLRELKAESGSDLRVALCKGKSSSVLGADSEPLKSEIDPDRLRPVKLFVAVLPKGISAERLEKFDQRLLQIGERFERVLTMYIKVPLITPELRKVHSIPDYEPPKIEAPVVNGHPPKVECNSEELEAAVVVNGDLPKIVCKDEEEVPVINGDAQVQVTYNSEQDKSVADDSELSQCSELVKGLTPEPQSVSLAESAASPSPEPPSESLPEASEAVAIAPAEKKKTTVKKKVVKKAAPEKAAGEEKQTVRTVESIKEVVENGVVKKVRVVKRIVKKDPTKKAAVPASTEKDEKPKSEAVSAEKTDSISEPENKAKPPAKKVLKVKAEVLDKEAVETVTVTLKKPKAAVKSEVAPSVVAASVEVVEEPSVSEPVAKPVTEEPAVDALAFLDSEQSIDTEPLFRVVSLSEEVGSDEMRLMQLQVDKHMTISTIKINLEPVLQVSRDYFKINRSRSEALKLSELASSVSDGDELLIELGRILQDGEYKYKVSFMKLPAVSDYAEELEQLCHIIVRNNQRVGEVKRDLLKYLEETGNKTISTMDPDRFRLWTKLYQSLSHPCVDEVVLGEDVILRRNGDFVLEELDDSTQDPMGDMDDFVIFIRKWNPDTLVLEPYHSLTLPLRSDLKQRLSEKSGIPIENLEYARNMAPFPKMKISKVSINDDMDWRSDAFITSFDTSRNGHCYFYRDNRVAKKELTVDESAAIQAEEAKQREAAKAALYGLLEVGGGGDSSTTSRYTNGSTEAAPSGSAAASKTRRKERGLKIYLDSSPAKVAS